MEGVRYLSFSATVQVNQYIKIIDVKADLKNVLVAWLDGWDHGKASDKTQYR